MKAKTQTKSSKPVTIDLPESTRDRLRSLALQYGLSLQEFSSHILTELSSQFEKESFSNYKNPDQLKKSFQNAMQDWDNGRVYTKL